MNTENNKAILDRLAQSQIFRDYQRAFGEATGMPLTLTPVENLQLAHRRDRHENPLCALMAKQNKTCAACLCAQHGLASKAEREPATVTCFAGLAESAVPVRVGEELIGFLRTGEVLTQAPTNRRFAQVTKDLAGMGLKADSGELRQAYFQSRVLEPKQYESVLHLLSVFAEHLSLVANQIVFRSEHTEAPNMTRAREYIAANSGEDLGLNQVAAAVHMSTFYFCKQFKKATGLSFTNYLSRVRVERAKQMLLNPHARISEIAFECGFQSLTHFNRIFRKLVGEAPSTYRASAPLALAA